MPAPRDPSDDTVIDIMAAALCENWNVEHANGPREATTPEDWHGDARAALTALTAAGYAIGHDATRTATS